MERGNRNDGGFGAFFLRLLAGMGMAACISVLALCFTAVDAVRRAAGLADPAAPRPAGAWLTAATDGCGDGEHGLEEVESSDSDNEGSSVAAQIILAPSKVAAEQPPPPAPACCDAGGVCGGGCGSCVWVPAVHLANDPSQGEAFASGRVYRK
jgi:hypothetical protein